MLLRGCRGAAGRAGEPDEVAGAAIGTPLKSPAIPTGQVKQGGFQADAVVDLVEEFQGVTARTVPLVDHGEDQDAAMAAHLEELESLRLKALRGIDEHDSAVDGTEHAVGVFGEVGVPRCVEQVDDAVPGRRPRDKETAGPWR